jgi:hypothetical protein
LTGGKNLPVKKLSNQSEVINMAGRPRKKIDQEQFEKLCKLQCTIDEFCCYFDCNTDTLEKWCKKTYKMNFSEVFRIKKGSGKISLRRKQFEVALSGNPTMLIWLGRNMLGQTDKIDLSIDSKKDGKLADLIDGLKEDDPL